MSKKFAKSVILMILILSAVFVFAKAAYAQSSFWSDPLGSLNPGTFTSVETGLGKVINTIITVSEIIFVILFLIGGVMYLTASGSEEQVSKARKLLLAAIIGIVIVFAGWAVSTWILNTLRSGSSTSPTPTTIVTPKPNATVPTTKVSPPPASPAASPTVNNSSLKQNCKNVCYKSADDMITNYGCRDLSGDEYTSCLQRFGIQSTLDECLRNCDINYP